MVGAVTVRNVDANAPRPTWLTVVASVVAAAMLAYRRRRPIATLAVIIVTVVVIALANVHEGSTGVMAAVAAYTAGTLVVARADRRRMAIVAGGLFVFLAIAISFRDNRGEQFGGLVALTILLSAGFLLGDNLRTRRQRLTDLRERNAQLERNAALEAANATAAERARIARELHDIVAHSVSVIAVQAGGARRIVAQRPEQAVEALGVIESTARQTLDELRRLLGVLRSTDETISGDHAPQPGLADVARLAASDPNLPITVSLNGTVRPLPSIVDVSAYRIVQEALTNVRKHAGEPTNVEVSVEYGTDTIVVSVTDDGRGAAADQGGTRGHGLVGMVERATLCGGTVAAGPRVGGGWKVKATLPATNIPSPSNGVRP